MRRCLGCNRLTPSSRCGSCQAILRAKYGSKHQIERANWAPIVETGTVRCWRCDDLIEPGEDWDLGHRENRPSHPEHVKCNRSNRRKN